jgi:curved DNA-binding protein CbpA
METILLLCCQSCLKSEDDIEYYERLAVSPSATSDEIKKAYKKKSLQLHPDRLAQKGIQVTSEHNQQFQQLKEAYDVLSDPRKRKLYDKIGKGGLKLIDSPQETNPMDLIRNFQHNKSDRFKLVLFLLFLALSILILPILFCLKCDGKIDNVPWLALWTPMWVIDCVAIIISILLAMAPDDDDDNEDEDNQHGDEENGRKKQRKRQEGEGGGGGGDDEDEEGNPSSKKKTEKVPLSLKVLFVIRTLVFVLIQIFILMRLDGLIEGWSWFAIFAPWFIYEAFAITDKLPSLLQSIHPVNETELERKMTNEMDEQERTMVLITAHEEHFKKLMERALARKSLLVSLLRIWLACFLAVQLDHTVNWDWGLVMLPIWAYFLLEIIQSYVLKAWGSALLEGIDLEACANGEILDPMVLLRAQHGQVSFSSSPHLFDPHLSAGYHGCEFIGLV